MPEITLKDVALAAGVHPSTVSRALDRAQAWQVNVRTRQRVIDTARDLGYQPDVLASSLRRGRTDTVGLIVADLGNPYIAPVVRGIENALDGHGLVAMIAETQDDAARTQRVYEHLMRRRVDAIITTATRAGDRAILDRVARRVPVVLAVRPLDTAGLATITNDDLRGGQLAAQHLADLGHRRVAQLVGPTGVQTFGERAEGFATTAVAAGMTVLPSAASATTPTMPEGQRLMRTLLQRHSDRPTAVFAHNDLMALGALAVLREERLLCPGDISLIGFNDTPGAGFIDPPLTTVRLPGYDLGRIAADVAVAMVEQPADSPPQLSLPPSLVVRGSTAPPT